jgi:hypothetical protein
MAGAPLAAVESRPSADTRREVHRREGVNDEKKPFREGIADAKSVKRGQERRDAEGNVWVRQLRVGVVEQDKKAGALLTASRKESTRLAAAGRLQ